MLSFEQWLTANDYDTPKSDRDRKHLEAAWKAETAPPPPVATLVASVSTATTYDQEVEAIRKEDSRQSRIREITTKAMHAAVGNKEKIDKFEQLCKDALSDKWDIQKFELAMLREERSVGPFFYSTRKPEVTSQVLEAGLAKYTGLQDVEKRFDPQVMEAVDKSFGRSGLSLLSLIKIGAMKNGWTGHDVKSDLRRSLKAAFRDHDDGGMHASVGPSTYSIPSILSNVANLHIRTAFEAVESEWRKIAFISSVTDYKEMTTVALTGDLTYKKVPRGGEVDHGTFGDLAYGNKADIYAILIGIDEQDLVNDSAGALTGASRRVGRGGALTLNQVVWAEWLDDAAFFPTDKSLANYDDGATDSMLTAAGLTNMLGIFRAQTDPDGKPLGIRPRILLVPPALEGAALTLMNSEFAATTGEANIWRNRFEVVSSDYLTDPLAWYLLANPQDLPAIEVVFLNGQQMPTTETADMAIDRLGIVIRGKHSFGARLQEYRAAAKAKGAA